MNGFTDLPPKLRSLIVRNRVTGCWLWRGGRSKGYGMCSIEIDGEGRQRGAHRVVYQLLRGPIPEGLHLDHLCFVKHCVNPEHVEPVTPAENKRRSIRSGDLHVIPERIPNPTTNRDFCRNKRAEWLSARTTDDQSAA